MRKVFIIYYEIAPMRAILEREVRARDEEHAKHVLVEQIKDNIKIRKVVEK